MGTQRGVIDEILVENLYRNREGNALTLDTILLEKVWQEENITNSRWFKSLIINCLVIFHEVLN